MIHIFLKRFAQALLMGWSVGTISFVIMRALPGDMAFRVAAGRYGYDNVDLAAAEAVREELGLDRPALQLYLEWLWDLLHGRLGDSLVSSLPVTAELWHLLEHTLILAMTAIVLAAFIALPVGIVAAIRRDGWFDRVSLGLSLLLRAQPVFVIGLLLILLFSLHWRMLPVAGFDGPPYLILPAISLALAMAAVSNRVVRHSAGDVLRSRYFEFARVKGLSFRQAFLHHGLRHLSLPVVAFMGIQLVSLIEGIVMIESLFSWPGLGHGLAHAIFSRDVPMIQGAALALGMIFVLLNLLVDVLCHVIDPRGAASS